MSNNRGMTIHAGRAILEESNGFTNEGKVVGEYVKNSWQYTDGPTTVNVLIDHKNKSIQIFFLKLSKMRFFGISSSVFLSMCTLPSIVAQSQYQCQLTYFIFNIIFNILS